MPEAPELAVSRDALRLLVEDRTIVQFSVGPAGRYLKTPPVGLAEFLDESKQSGPPRVEEVATRGKFMWWRLKFPMDQEEWYLHCTYGMSGAWQTSSSKHTAAAVSYSGDGGSGEQHVGRLFFNDPRHFGTLKFVRGGVQHRKKLATLGPCILGGQLTPGIFAERLLRKPERTIAEALMDQSGVAGCGNYIKAECLYRSGISPWRRVAEVTPEEYVRLCKDLVDVTTESYRSQGASIKTYRNVDNSKGTNQFNFKIYSKNRCLFGHPVINETTLDGRTSWWCENCQK